MKKNINIITMFIIGIIVSIIMNVYSITKVTTKEVTHKQDKKLESTSDPDYISGVYSSSNTLSSNYTTLKSRVDSVDLLSSTTKNSSTTSGSYNYHSISNMNKYSVIFFHAHVANVHRLLVCPYGYTREQLIFNENSVNSNYRIRGGYICDWTNNRIGIRYLDALGYGYDQVQVWEVYGFIKRS